MKPVQNTVVAIRGLSMFRSKSRDENTNSTDKQCQSILARQTAYRKPFSVQKSIRVVRCFGVRAQIGGTQNSSLQHAGVTPER